MLIFLVKIGFLLGCATAFQNSVGKPDKNLEQLNIAFVTGNKMKVIYLVFVYRIKL